MAEENQWWDERNGRLFRKEDEVPLQQAYMPRSHKGGFIQQPSFVYPKCNRETPQQEERKVTYVSGSL